MLVPKLRFPHFTDTWEQRKLETISDVRDGTHDSPQYVQDGHPFITSKNVGNGFINYDDIQYVSDIDYKEINKRSKVDIHDILMGMIGTIGNIALVREKPDFAIKNVALIKYTGIVNYKFLYQTLQSSYVTNQLLSGMDGGTQKFIALNKIRGLDIPYPSLNEQCMIGVYFENLDNLITLHQRKYDSMLEYKKGLLQKMFPKEGETVPEVRFPGFDGEWEEHQLIEMFKYEQPTKYIVEDSNYEGCSKYPVLTANKGFVLGYTNETNGVYDKGDVIIFDDFTCDHKYVNFPFKVKSSAIKFLTSNESYDLQFLSKLLSSIDQKPLSHQRHWISIMQPTVALTPSFKEQQKIGSFFKSLDEEIELQKQKIELIKEYKKGLLQQMFI